MLLVGGAAAAFMNEGVRNKLLDKLFGAEEEFEYTSTDVQPAPTEPAAATTAAGASSNDSSESTAGDAASTSSETAETSSETAAGTS